MESQLKTILKTADGHFKSKGYQVENLKTGALHERIYVKDDISYVITYWKKDKYNKYSALVSVFKDILYQETEDVFTSDKSTKEKHYESIQSNLKHILDNIKSQN